MAEPRPTGPETVSGGKSTAELLTDARERLNRETQGLSDEPVAAPMGLSDDELPWDTTPAPRLELWEDGDEAGPPVDTPSGAPLDAEERLPKTPVEDRLETVARKAGISVEDYLQAMETLADNPDPYPAVGVEEEVSMRLGADQSYVALYNACQNPDSFSSEMERLLAVQMLQNATNLARQAVTGDRRDREAATRTQTAVAREQIEELASDPQFAPYLRTREAKEALRKYAKEQGLQDMKVAAKSHLFDRAFQQGRTTASRARKASVTRGGSSDGTIPKPAPPASEAAIKQGLWAFTQHIRGGRKSR